MLNWRKALGAAAILCALAAISGNLAHADGGPAQYRWVDTCNNTFGPTDASSSSTLTVDKRGNTCVVDASGGGGSGGLSVVDAAAWTTGVSAFTPGGGVFNDSAAALSSGTQGTMRLTPNRAQHVNLRNQAGTEIGTAAAPVRIDPTGTTPQPVTMAAVPTGAALDATVATTNTDLGPPGATACATDTASCSLNALLQRIAQNLTTVNTTAGNAATVVPGTSGGLTTFFLQPAASDNHTNIKNGAGQVYHVSVTNNSATINYLRFYNAATGFNGCNSATGLVYQLAIPASTSGAGFVQDIGYGLVFSTGISICVTSAYATTDTTNATASAMSLLVGYK